MSRILQDAAGEQSAADEPLTVLVPFTSQAVECWRRVVPSSSEPSDALFAGLQVRTHSVAQTPRAGTKP